MATYKNFIGKFNMSMRDILHLLPKPSHFAGVETGSIKKDPSKINLHIALAFPDTYEVASSYLGQKILYNIVNSHENWWAERAYLPEKEAADLLRKHDVELCSLESDKKLREMDALCFSVTHELCYTDILHMLDLAKIPLRAEKRPESLESAPIIMAGGGALPGAEALMPFIDLAAIGDGEELIVDILACLQEAKEKKWSRTYFLAQAAKIPGVYVPSLFPADKSGIPRLPEGMEKPARRIMADLNSTPYPVNQILPVGAIHKRLAIEIARGCTRGCRFCHAGFVYRPLRERDPEKINQILEEALKETGYDEVSFMALSAGDHSALSTVFADSFERCSAEQISLALPSLRVGSVQPEILARMASLRRTGITLAPEAGSQRLRDVINKGITEDALLQHIELLQSFGWQHVKLYFMIGLPTETDKDLAAIVDLCDKIRDAARKKSQKIQVTAALSTFVPKPFTPFQWEEQASLTEIERRINYILELAKNRKYLKIRWHNPEISHLEGILSRADRRMADVIEKAYEKGAVYTGWTEHFRLEPWLEAMEECGLNAAEFIGARKVGDMLPWSHLEIGARESFLARERTRAYEARTSADCRTGACGLCGACDVGAHKSLLKTSPGFTGEIRPVLVKTSLQKENNNTGQFQANGVSPPKIRENLRAKQACFRIWHEKLKEHAWLSQLELQDELLRALRRAKIPLAFSGGFHPTPLVSFTRALAVGLESDAEWFSVILREQLSPILLMEMLNEKLPENLQIILIETCRQNERTIQADSEQFTISFMSGEPHALAINFLKLIDSEKEYLYSWQTKKGKRQIDLKTIINGWQDNGENRIALCLDWKNAYVSPLHVAKSLVSGFDNNNDLNLPMYKIRKNAQFFGQKCYGKRVF